MESPKQYSSNILAKKKPFSAKATARTIYINHINKSIEVATIVQHSATLSVNVYTNNSATDSAEFLSS